MDLKIKFNEETDEIEFELNDRVIDRVEANIVESWITAYNKKHGFVKPVQVEEPEVAEVTTDTEGTDEQSETSEGETTS